MEKSVSVGSLVRPTPDIFTKEDNDIACYCGLRDLMIAARESFYDQDNNKSNEVDEMDEVMVGTDKENRPTSSRKV